MTSEEWVALLEDRIELARERGRRESDPAMIVTGRRGAWKGLGARPTTVSHAGRDRWNMMFTVKQCKVMLARARAG